MLHSRRPSFFHDKTASLFWTFSSTCSKVLKIPAPLEIRTCYQGHGAFANPEAAPPFGTSAVALYKGKEIIGEGAKQLRAQGPIGPIGSRLARLLKNYVSAQQLISIRTLSPMN
jgi:hypothetical protein